MFHSTVSSIEESEPQLIEILEAGCDVISTCEELSYPQHSNHDAAKRIDEVAKENGVTCLSTGINPGFVMDALPVLLSTPVNRVDSIHVNRVQDAEQRRISLQQKIGAGLPVAEFDSQIATGAGHVGSRESVAMLADGVGWSLTEVSEAIEPVVADETVDSHVAVTPGDVAGVNQTVRGTTASGKEIVLDLQMYVGAENPRDEIRLQGSQDLTVTVDGGYHGDYSTSAIVTNLVDNVLGSGSGLRTMLDIPTPSHRDTYSE
ncbi:NAD(P)H-dependent amine dehydrogenase family protein [Halostagnicola larsenii]|uniref:NAD(P)H-dependent amine dehydrogenase family protein n=1 Tax=Halostagnicola larsenii TaxID=353800 RepID=UPI0012FBBFCA|nr:dihydrodipicolinate reductase [Halostagnicola larsenii]